MTTIADIKNHKANGPWRGLERLADAMVKDASTAAKSTLLPVLGGGTRLMLAMEHRISDDIDLFIRDPQWIGFLTPRLNDKFEHLINTYDEGATSLRTSCKTSPLVWYTSAANGILTAHEAKQP